MIVYGGHRATNGGIETMKIKKNICIAFLIMLQYNVIWINNSFCKDLDKSSIQSVIKSIDSSQLKSTIITPVLDTKIENGKNMIYCASFQMAWNSLCKDVLKETAEIENAPEYVKLLNDNINEPLSLPEESCIAMAGFKKDNIEEKFLDTLKDKFKNLSKETISLYNPKLKNDNDIGVLSSFFKDIKFEFPFKENNVIFKFGKDNVKVKSFGLENYFSYRESVLCKQFKVLYQFKENLKIDSTSFKTLSQILPRGLIIKLVTSSKTDDLIISTIPVENSLNKSYEKVMEIVDNSNVEHFLNIINKHINHPIDENNVIFNVDLTNKEINLSDNFSIFIPIININFNNAFSDLSNTNSINLKPIKINNIKSILYNNQSLIIKINNIEKMLKSFTYDSEMTERKKPYKYSIDSPFIIFLKHKSSKYPYFMAYICNDELLEKVNETSK